MAVAIQASLDYAKGLNEKFDPDGKDYRFFTVAAGKRWDKIVHRYKKDDVLGESVHAFVDRATGHVYKPEGWAKPARGVRYLTVADALINADPYGQYLYR